MVVILVHVGKNLVKDVLLVGGFEINIITKDLWKKLGFPTPRLAPYTFRNGKSYFYQTCRVNPRFKNPHTWHTLCCYCYSHVQQYFGLQLFHVAWTPLVM